MVIFSQACWAAFIEVVMTIDNKNEKPMKGKKKLVFISSSCFHANSYRQKGNRPENLVKDHFFTNSHPNKDDL